MKTKVALAVLHVRNALGFLQACLLEETKDGLLGTHDTRCYCLTVEKSRCCGHTASPHQDGPRHPTTRRFVVLWKQCVFLQAGRRERETAKPHVMATSWTPSSSTCRWFPRR